MNSKHKILGASQHLIMLEAIAEKLNQYGLKASVEYPEFIQITKADCLWNVGTHNGMIWEADKTTLDGAEVIETRPIIHLAPEKKGAPIKSDWGHGASIAEAIEATIKA